MRPETFSNDFGVFWNCLAESISIFAASQINFSDGSNFWCVRGSISCNETVHVHVLWPVAALRRQLRRRARLAGGSRRRNRSPRPTLGQGFPGYGTRSSRKDRPGFRKYASRSPEGVGNRLQTAPSRVGRKQRPSGSDETRTMEDIWSGPVFHGDLPPFKGCFKGMSPGKLNSRCARRRMAMSRHISEACEAINALTQVRKCTHPRELSSRRADGLENG